MSRDQEPKTKIKSLRFAELELFMESIGARRFRAKQVFDWMHNRQVRSFEEMNNLPKPLREKLAEVADLEVIQTESVQVSQKDGTRKYLFRLEDGQYIESVCMEYANGRTVCISTQVGCRMGCAFCASGEGGLVRQLTAGEILEQVLAVSRDIGVRVHNIVVMGVGEPFDNYDNLLRFLDIVHDKRGIGVGYRNITVSTCGVVPKIAGFGRNYPQVTLAISLHAPSDTVRNRLMPINRAYSFDTLMASCREYVSITNRRVTFEYILLEGENDELAQADELARHLQNILCHVNLLSFNGVDGKSWRPTPRERILAFQQRLQQQGIETTIRRELGSDINGACGQLRARWE